MIVSLNELEFTVRKAVRGAGYHWGEAEEAGKAAVWLARHGLPVAGPLLTLLRAAGREPNALRPVPGSRSITAIGPLCPLLTGIAIADGAVELGAGAEVILENILSPVLLLPFIALAAAGGDRSIILSWPGGKAAAGLHDVAADLNMAAPERPVTATLSVRAATPEAASRPAVHRVLDVEPAAWDALNAFAAETYVPATDRSRRAGAGAGLADND